MSFMYSLYPDIPLPPFDDGTFHATEIEVLEVDSRIGVDGEEGTLAQTK